MKQFFLSRPLANRTEGQESKQEWWQTVYWIVESLRPVQWIKNGFILIPLIFARRIFAYESFLRSISAVAIFCLLASAIYLINDLSDVKEDRLHPAKKDRPLPSGKISPLLAKITAFVLLLASLAWGAYMGIGFFIVLLIYLTIQLFYSYGLKRVVIIDIFCVSSGFFLRVVAGALAIQVEISHWLIICTVLISMFLALGKRRHELSLLGKTEAGNHRKVLEKYDVYLLDQMIGVITAGTLLSYMLYSVSQETIEKFHTDHMIYSSPFVLFGIFRYLYLIHKGDKGGAPEKVLISDRPLLVNVVLWALVCLLVIYGVL